MLHLMRGIPSISDYVPSVDPHIAAVTTVCAFVLSWIYCFGGSSSNKEASSISLPLPKSNSAPLQLSYTSSSPESSKDPSSPPTTTTTTTTPTPALTNTAASASSASKDKSKRQINWEELNKHTKESPEPWPTRDYRALKSHLPTQSLQATVSNSMEEPMLSAPYGIETPIDEELNMETEDIFRDMLERQINYVSPSDYAPSASYLPHRRYLVDWMSDVGEKCRFHTSTVHVSILFLDKIFRSNDIPRSQWQLLATACISVAAKYEEAEEHCPPIPDLLQLTRLNQAGHTSLSFREGELEVLRHLGWRLRAIPPIHFIGYFLAKGTTFVDDTWQNRCLTEKIPEYVKKYADFFCDLTLQEYSFQKYLPSVLAAAILMASRVALQLQPRWRPELVRLTGYEERNIIKVFTHVWSYYEEQFPGHGHRSTSPRVVTSDMSHF